MGHDKSRKGFRIAISRQKKKLPKFSSKMCDFNLKESFQHPIEKPFAFINLFS